MTTFGKKNFFFTLSVYTIRGSFLKSTMMAERQ